MKLAGFEVGLDRPFFLIAGPCVIESMQLQLDTAATLKEITSDLGGTMRLGLQDQRIKPGTLAHKLYGKDVVGERHRHRYEFNNRYRTQLEDAGLVFSAKSMDDLLVEMIELPQSAHPWFLACQAHPEFLSTPRDGHPLFIGFIRAAREHKAQAGGRLLKEATA